MFISEVSLGCVRQKSQNSLTLFTLKWQPTPVFLPNPKDGGAWWAAIYGAAQSWTQLKHLSSSSLFPHQAATVASMVCLLAAIYSELSLQELLVQAGKIPIQ